MPDEKETMRNTKSITVFDALAKVKILKKRINELAYSNEVPGSVNTGDFYFVACKESELDSTMQREYKKSVEQMDADAKARWQRLTSLISRANLIQGLIHESNAKTPITVAGVEFSSVAKAMNRYETINDEILIYTKILQKYSALKSGADRDNEKNLDFNAITKAVNPSGAQIEPEVFEALKESYIKNTRKSVHDFAGIVTGENPELMRRLKEATAFKDEFNAALNRCNLSTYIEVPNDELAVDYVEAKSTYSIFN